MERKEKGIAALVDLAAMFYEHGGPESKMRAVGLALMCWAEQIRRNQTEREGVKNG